MEDNKKMQQLYLQLQLAGQQIRQLEEQVSVINSKIEEMKVLKESVKELASSKKAKTLFDVGSGVYAEGALANPDEVIINVGAGVFVKKTAEKAIEAIEKQIEMMNQYLENSNANLQFLNQQAMALQEEAKSLI